MVVPIDYSLLRAEPWWNAEKAPPALENLYIALRRYLNRDATAVGGKGDNRHLRGYHRSRAWILNSRYSLYHTGDYSIQSSLDKGGDDNWYCALDATPWRVETLIEMCKRLAPAVRGGHFPQIREWYGNVDGDQIVDGFDTLRQRVATSDSSHLWHLHISFYRARANDDHTALIATLTGDDVLSPQERSWIYNAASQLASEARGLTAAPIHNADDKPDGLLPLKHIIKQNEMAEQIVSMRAAIDALAAGQGNTDVAAILNGMDERLSAQRIAIEKEMRDAVADLGEGGASQVRTDADI